MTMHAWQDGWPTKMISRALTALSISLLFCVGAGTFPITLAPVLACLVAYFCPCVLGSSLVQVKHGLLCFRLAQRPGPLWELG